MYSKVGILNTRVNARINAGYGLLQPRLRQELQNAIIPGVRIELHCPAMVFRRHRFFAGLIPGVEAAARLEQA